MIRAAITGGATSVAGEIMKLLINHPDVELQWVLEPAFEGALLSQIHKGLRGETYMRFSALRICRLPMSFFSVLRIRENPKRL